MPTVNLNPGDLYFNNDFNDATRELTGGLWHNTVSDGNQGFGTDLRVANDLTVVQAGLQEQLAAGDFSGDQLTHVNTILADLATELTNIPGAVNNDAAAEQAVHNAHLDIISTINGDAELQALSIKDNNLGFNPTSPALAAPVTAQTPHATFAELGAIFDDAQNRMLGGLNATVDGAAQIKNDLTVVENGLTALMKAHPEQFGGATGIHAQTIVDQIHLQVNNFDNQYGTSPDAARSSNDNFLDITDIVAGDTNLTNMAHQNGVNGWTAAPATDVVPTPFQDNADQTNFWADFISSSNTLGAKAEQLVQTGTHAEINAFEKTLVKFETNVGNFDGAQGGIFSARFDNELAGGPNSTVAADVAAMIKGLDTHNAALVTAAAEGFHANAADVSGNNVPVNGGTYNGDGTTIALALANTMAPPPPATTLVPATVAMANNGHQNGHSLDMGQLGMNHSDMSHVHDVFHWDFA